MESDSSYLLRPLKCILVLTSSYRKAKLKHYGLEHLQTEWKRPSYEELDKIDRKNQPDKSAN